MTRNSDQDDGFEGVGSVGRFANAIVVTVEGLGTNLVGCYGNALTPTPAWDRFASQSLVADQFWMDGLDPVEVLKSMWSGLHRRERAIIHEGENASQEKMKIPGLLVTDDPRVYEAALRYIDGEVQLVEIAYTVETRFSSLVLDALNQWIPKLEKYPWLWIHSRGLQGPWDAPYELRLTMCDEGDPKPPSDVEPPVRIVDSSTDPDEIFGWACGAGGQVIAMDEVWGLLADTIQELGFEASALVVLAGVHGYPLGEHGMVGLLGESGNPDVPATTPPKGSMYAERLHCPLIIRPGDRLPLSIRFSQFVQPHHLAGVIEDWIEGSAWIEGDAASEGDRHFQSTQADGIESARDGWTLSKMMHGSGVDRLRWLPFQRSAFAWGEKEAALMLPSWSARFSTLEPNSTLADATTELWGHLVTDAASIGIETAETDRDDRDEVERGPLTIELFAMPDDRWQQNEISARAPAVVDAMNSLLNAWMQIDVHGRDRLTELLWNVDEALLTPIR